ncbi:hypothetical protein SARC_12644 [Sphaeroforma arctica JP610]|uniref:Uncharacterized protein n=1 Tax=Sphaeroforma arctica JP610 TaxID=667725 RepID=A0A0L0FDI1_9EUKA|nr:hypothetical protein SARC_12644 [Sphaeroforma arctica JP610]KNC74817.1 hypothetical protein SARC_12644 [Sphaeroforma arctica JP610]|eukprot:XP_014148719.1 hypothetical protein SARC_12644 [Sphaeroforma arctica JP610]
MRQLFLALAALEHHDTISAIERYSRLHALLPQNTHIKLQLAVSYFNARDMDEAQSLFEEVRQKEPNNLERVDYYSHILYVKKLTVWWGDALLLRDDTVCVCRAKGLFRVD